MSYVYLKDLAAELNADRSALRRAALKLGIPLQRLPGAGTRGQPALVLSPADADRLRASRAVQGDGAMPALVGDVGVFYAIQVVPELAPTRIKFGFASHLPSRLAAHRTAVPTADVLATWPCRRTWELAAMAAVTRDGCRCLANEVYDVDSVAAVRSRADAFFALLPAP